MSFWISGSQTFFVSCPILWHKKFCGPINVYERKKHYIKVLVSKKRCCKTCLKSIVNSHKMSILSSQSRIFFEIFNKLFIMTNSLLQKNVEKPFVESFFYLNRISTRLKHKFDLNRNMKSL